MRYRAATFTWGRIQMLTLHVNSPQRTPREAAWQTSCADSTSAHDAAHVTRPRASGSFRIAGRSRPRRTFEEKAQAACGGLVRAALAHRSGWKERSFSSSWLLHGSYGFAPHFGHSISIGTCSILRLYAELERRTGRWPQSLLRWHMTIDGYPRSSPGKNSLRFAGNLPHRRTKNWRSRREKSAQSIGQRSPTPGNGS